MLLGTYHANNSANSMSSQSVNKKQALARNHGHQLRAIALGIVTFLVLPNLAFAISLFDAHFERAIFNIDYLMLGAAAVFLTRWQVVGILIFLAGADLAVTASRMYFFRIDELFFNVRFLTSGLSLADGDLPIANLAFFFVSIFASAFLIVRFSEMRRSRVGLVLLSLAVLLGASDVLNGSSFARSLSAIDGVQLLPFNIAYSPSLVAATQFQRDATNESIYSMPSATKHFFHVEPASDLSGVRLPPDIKSFALIIVESWGSGGATFDEWVVNALYSPTIRNSYDIEIGSVPYGGATTRGELRELCGLFADYKTLPISQANKCLPNVLRGEGLHTVALHGFSGAMYDRNEWRPRVGFAQTIFKNDMPVSPPCRGLFPGVCDRFLISQLGEVLSKNAPVFAYALTLGSHLPLAPPTADQWKRHCGSAPERLGYGECALVIAWRNVFAAVAAQALTQRDRHTAFLLVGDHVPPLWRRSGRALFNHGVPYLILRPK